MNPDIEMGEILNSIGQEIAEITGRQPVDALLYAEVDDEGYEISIFADEDEAVLYHFPNKKIFELVQHLWEIADDNKKWYSLELQIAKGDFEANFTFSDQIDPNEIDGDDEEDRCDLAIRRRFGDKPVIYPDLGPGAVKLAFEDPAHPDGADA